MSKMKKSKSIIIAQSMIIAVSFLTSCKTTLQTPHPQTSNTMSSASPMPNTYATPPTTPIPENPIPAVWPSNIQPLDPVQTPMPIPYPVKDCSQTVRVEHDRHEKPRWSHDSQWLSYANVHVVQHLNSIPFCGEGSTSETSRVGFWSASNSSSHLLSTKNQTLQIIDWVPKSQQLYVALPLKSGSGEYLPTLSRVRKNFCE